MFSMFQPGDEAIVNDVPCVVASVGYVEHSTDVMIEVTGRGSDVRYPYRPEQVKRRPLLIGDQVLIVVELELIEATVISFRGMTTIQKDVRIAGNILMCDTYFCEVSYHHQGLRQTTLVSELFILSQPTNDVRQENLLYTKSR